MRRNSGSSKGGLKIFTRHWRPQGDAEGSIGDLATGSTRMAGSTSGAAEQFAEERLCGHARSTCAAAASRKASATMSRRSTITWPTSPVAIKLAKSRDPGLPVFLLGHSAGGVASITYTLDNQDQLAGLHLRELRLPRVRARTSR